MSTPALANLLAREALTVVQSREATTASFDLQARLLTLPVWDVPQPVTHMLVAHEVGHALYSPADLPAAIAAEWPDAPPASHALLNMFEDIRIDRLVQREYPGTRRDYHTGNWHIWTTGLLGTYPPESLPTLPFPVRALLQHRLGAQLAIPFTPEEQAVLPELLAPRDFAHVVALTRRYWTEATHTPPPPPSDAPPPPDPQAGADGPDGASHPSPDSSDGAPTSTPDVGDGQTEQQTDEAADTPAPTDPAIPADPFEAWVRGQVAPPSYGRVDTYILDRLPDVREQSLRAHPRIDDFTLKLRHEPERTTATDCWRQCAADASVMAAAFRRYKAAQQRSKEQYRRTGDLDMQRLHSYRWADDLFKRAVRLPQGQSHALCIAVDFSQSMASLLGYGTPGPLLRQLVTLVEFCRQCHIPYEVYTWTGEARQTGPQNVVTKLSDTYVTLRALHLFSSTDGTQDHADAISALTTLWQLHLRPNMLSWSAEDRLLALGYTPLAELLLHLPVWLRRFRGIDHVAAIVLTDGEPTSGANSAASRVTEPATGLLLHAAGRAHYTPHVGSTFYQCLWERIHALTNAQCYCYRLCESQRDVRRQQDMLTRYAPAHITPEQTAALDSRSAPYHQFTRLWGMDQYLVLTPAAFDTDPAPRRTAPVAVTDTASLKKLAASLTKSALAAAKLRPFLTTVGTALASDLRPTTLSR